MIVVDTSIWIDHLRRPDPILADLLAVDDVLAHPYVIGEIMLGSIKDRHAIGAELNDLSPAETAEHDEVMTLIERHALFGRGIGYVDAPPRGDVADARRPVVDTGSALGGGGGRAGRGGEGGGVTAAE